MALCCFHLQGACRFGTTCRFPHEAPIGQFTAGCHFGPRCRVGHYIDGERLSPGEQARHRLAQQHKQDAVAEQMLEAEIQGLCLAGEAERAWQRFLDMRRLWRDAQGRRRSRPGCDFHSFNAPYQRAFACIRRLLGPPVALAPLPERRWVGTTKDTTEASGSVPLRVFSLNVLSEHLNNLFSFQFVVLPPGGGDFLPWACRAPLIIQEIARWRPQLAALQEVDDALYDSLARDIACGAGLAALPFAPRNPQPRSDGVCILFDPSVLQPVPGSHVVRHLTHGQNGSQHPGGVIAVAIFDVVVAGHALGVRLAAATAHVNPSPAAKDALESGVEPQNGEELGTDAIVAAQLITALEEACAMCGGCCDVRIFLGDLNGVTDGGAETLGLAGMTSAYSAAGEDAMEDWCGSLVTSHNDMFHWGGELDHVLCRGAEVRGVLQLPSHPRLKPFPRPRDHPSASLPMAGWPSDHMSLVADLALRPRAR